MKKSLSKERAPAQSRLRLRPVNWVHDLATIYAIEQAGFAIPWRWHQFFAFSYKSRAAGLVAEEVSDIFGKPHAEPIVVGFMLYENHDDHNHVAHIAVHPDSQNMGVGRTMLMAICEPGLNIVDGVVHEALPVTLNVRLSNRRAQELYDHLGFAVVEVRPDHYANHETALVMQYGAGDGAVISLAEADGSPQTEELTVLVS